MSLLYVGGKKFLTNSFCKKFLSFFKLIIVSVRKIYKQRKNSLEKKTEILLTNYFELTANNQRPSMPICRIQIKTLTLIILQKENTLK